jgi:hypothetical protein
MNSVVDKIKKTFTGPHKEIVCDWYFTTVRSIIGDLNSVLDYGSGNCYIKFFFLHTPQT